MFDAPVTGGSLKPADVEGHLLVVEPLEYVTNMTTAYGESDAVRVTVHDISAQETHENVLWFPKALVGSLKPSIGKRILAVMGKGTAKQGQSPPWVLIDATANSEAVTAATNYLNGQVAATITAPAQAPQAANDPLAAALGNLATAGLKN